MHYLLITILGLAVGSFISVISLRLAKQEKGIFLGRSYCRYCKHQLKAFDLVPVLSYLWLKFKCRYCKEKISSEYLLLEIITAVVYLLTYLKFSNNLPLLIGYLTVFTLAIAIAHYDLKTQEIPIKLSLPLAIIATFISLYFLPFTFREIALAAILGFGFFYLQYLFSRGKIVGLGDADLGLIIGVLTGPQFFLQTILLSYIMGAVVGVYLILKHKKSLKTKLAFAPYLMLSLFLNILYQQEITQFIFPAL